jgi:hypothetical protein
LESSLRTLSDIVCQAKWFPLHLKCFNNCKNEALRCKMTGQISRGSAPLVFHKRETRKKEKPSFGRG